MRKTVMALIATLAFGWVMAGATTSAGAHACASCSAPVPPTTIYKTVHPSQFMTKYHDVSVTRHVRRVHRVTTVVRVQPILHIHEVTRVHHHTVVTTRNAYHRQTEHLAPIREVTHSTQNIYECGCRP